MIPDYKPLYLNPKDLNRRSGRTTRQIDEEIQEFFKNGTVIIHDHASEIGNIAQQEHVRTLFRRLENEHKLTLKNLLDFTKSTGLLKWKTK